MASIWIDNIRAKANSPQVKLPAALVFGCLIVCSWTLIRFFDQSANFDQVGQLSLAHQWLHGEHIGSVIGPTNYILKIIFLYIPFDFIPLSAQLKLIILTLLVNIATFLLIFIGLKKIWQEFYKNQYCVTNLYFPLIYLALISGSVFWISFTNSRNLEVAAGVFLIYLYLRAQSNPTKLNFGLSILLGSVLFFADPLQIYMTALPIVIFMVWRYIQKRNNRNLKVLVGLFLSIDASVLISKFLVRLVEHLASVSFVANSQSPSFNLSSLKSAAEQAARLYAGGYEGGRFREAINLLVLGSTIMLAGYVAWRYKKSRPILALCVAISVVDMVIYIVSGQAQQSDTNRYLIMTVPAFLLALGTVLYHLHGARLRSLIIGIVVALGTLTLGSAFTRAWSPSMTVNGHDRAAIEYLSDHHYDYGYASINTALASNYLSNWKVNLLPLGCDPDLILKKTTLFFDKSAFQVSSQPGPDNLIPLILDKDNITIAPTTCTIEDIKKQLGPWQTVDHLSDQSLVLLYNANQLKALRNFSQL
jgi:hypothetical protein